MLQPPVSECSNLGHTLVLPLKAVPLLSPFVEETGFLFMMPETDTGTTEWAVTTSGLREKVGWIKKRCLLHVKSWREDGTVWTFLTKGFIWSLGRLKLNQAVRGFTWPKPVNYNQSILLGSGTGLGFGCVVLVPILIVAQWSSNTCPSFCWQVRQGSCSWLLSSLSWGRGSPSQSSPVEQRGCRPQGPAWRTV